MRVLRTLVGVTVAAAAVGLTPVAGEAQCPTVLPTDPANSTNRLLSDACNKANDAFQLVAPQVSVMLAGGNPSPSIGGTLGGFPHFNVGVRVNAVQGVLPRLDQASPGLGFSGAQASNIPVTDVLLVMPQVDAQIGLFKGFKLGLPIPFLGITNMFGVDALVSAAYLPSASARSGGNGIALEGGQVAVGYGARLGIFEESLLAPGLAVSYMLRPTPEVTLEATRGADTLGVRRFKVNTSSLRITASKTIPIIGVGLSAGIGQDVVDGSANLVVSATPLAPLPTARVRDEERTTLASVTRRNVFVGASLKFLIVRLAAEVGYVSGGTNPRLTNAFLDGSDLARPMDGRRYATVSARIGL
jgi:hypothetical protein